MKVQRVLVTGGTGFIGSHLVDRLVVNGFKVVVLDNLSTGRAENIQCHLKDDSVRLFKGDVKNYDDVSRAVDSGVDAVFHLAAVTSVSQSIKDPVLTNLVNVDGTLNVLRASLKVGIKRVIYASSSAVYGEAERMPIAEDSTTRPIAPYGVSKLISERYCREFNDVSGLETVCLRFFNVYGARQANNQYSGVILSFLNKLMCGEPPIIYGDGMQSRDFVCVKDVVNAMLLALNCENAYGEVFNIGTGSSTTIKRLAEVLIDLLERDVEPIYAERRFGDISNSCADIGKARRILGYIVKEFRTLPFSRYQVYQEFPQGTFGLIELIKTNKLEK